MTPPPGGTDPKSLDPNGPALGQPPVESGPDSAAPHPAAPHPAAPHPAAPHPAAPHPAAPIPRWAELVARVLDDAIAIPGTRIRFGLDGIVGMFLPGAGDAVTAAGSAALLLLAIQRRVPTAVLVRMLLNIALDVCAGVIPVVGDLFDFAHKSNRKNLELIRGERPGVATRGRVGDAVLLAIGLVLLTLCVLLPVLVWLVIISVIEG